MNTHERINHKPDDYKELELVKSFSPDHYQVYRQLKLNKYNLIADLESFCEIYETTKFYKIAMDLLCAKVIRVEKNNNVEILYPNSPNDWKIEVYLHSEELKKKLQGHR